MVVFASSQVPRVMSVFYGGNPMARFILDIQPWQMATFQYYRLETRIHCTIYSVAGHSRLFLFTNTVHSLLQYVDPELVHMCEHCRQCSVHSVQYDEISSATEFTQAPVAVNTLCRAEPGRCEQYIKPSKFASTNLTSDHHHLGYLSEYSPQTCTKPKL